MVAMPEPRFVTPEEYLERERVATTKSEYVNGRIYAMAGCTRAHDLIAGNFYGEVREQLKGRPCEVYTSDMRVRILPTGRYTYPDASAICGEPLFDDATVDTLLNPAVLLEVLSPTTEADDRSDKFAHYRRLASVQDILFAAQDSMHVEHYRRQGEQWILTEYDLPQAVLTLDSIGCTITLSELYDKVNFPAQAVSDGQENSGGAADLA